MIDLVICAPIRWGNPGGWDDNVYGVCARCAGPIQYRPHAPAAAKKVCAPCALDLQRYAITVAGR